MDYKVPNIETLSEEELRQLYELKYFRNLIEKHNWEKGKVQSVAMSFEDQNFVKHAFYMLMDPQYPVSTPFQNSKIPEQTLIDHTRYYVKCILEIRFVDRIMKEGAICPHCKARFATAHDVLPHFYKFHASRQD